MKYDTWREIEPNTFLMFLRAILGEGTNIHWQPTLLNRLLFKATHLVNVKKYSKNTNTIKTYPLKGSFFPFLVEVPFSGLEIFDQENQLIYLGSYYHQDS